MWKALLSAADEKDAEVYVGLSKTKSEYVPATLAPYVVDCDIEGKEWVFRGGANILPTNDNPLTQVVADNLKSVIIPSPKNRGKFFPCYSGKIIHATTGSLSMPEYAENLQGDRSAQKHCMSVIYLEDHGHYFDLRALYWKDGWLCDVDQYYNHKGQVKAAKILNVKLPDIHCGEVKQSRLLELCDLVQAVKPDHVMVDDLISFQRYSHHNRHKPGYGSSGLPLEEEIGMAAEFLTDLQELAQVMVTPSNHHEHLSQWVETGPKLTSVGEIRDYGFACMMYAEAAANGTSTFEEAINCFTGDIGIQFLDERKAYSSKNQVYYYHGHFGANGSRHTSAAALSKLPFKSTVGHGHTPGWHDHAYVAGAAPDVEDASYTRGASSWSCSAVVEHHNGVRQLINLVKGSWGI
jgi:hypothetical protein